MKDKPGQWGGKSPNDPNQPGRVGEPLEAPPELERFSGQAQRPPVAPD